MDLKSISKEINDLLEKRRQELELTFIEDKHTYYMKDTEGVLRKTFPSVSKLIKKFHKPFDSEGMALRMCKGDPEAAGLLQEQWKELGRLSTNLGSRVHFELESELVSRYGDFKQVRRPIFECNQEQLNKSDKMINAGKDFINIMEERGAVLLDTEIVLGDNELGYTGQADKSWLMMNREKNNFGLVITDWKTNQPKNFEVHHYTGNMYSPFSELPDNSLGHYYIQLPLYGRLLLKMLGGTKYGNINLLGCVVVLLKDDGTFAEYKVPPGVNKGILNLDLSRYIDYGKKSYTYVN
jgi:hypothetical protein